MKKTSRTYHSSSKHIQTGNKPLTWKKTLLSNAVAFAVAGFGASSGFAACPGTVTGAETTVCNLAGTDSVTINSGASIQVVGPRAIDVAPVTTNVTINNAGTVSARSSDANAIFVRGDFNGTITNTGTILGDGTDTAAGIFVDSDFAAASTLTNRGTITGSAISGESSADATGITLNYNLFGAVTNEAGGLISAVAEGSDASATGVLVYYDLASTGSITNHGTISASAVASSSSATAYGIYIDDYLEGIINNTGTISATATGASEAEAYGIYLSSTNTAGSQITNSGTISVTAAASNEGSGTAEAYGLYFSEDFEGMLDNSGTITVTANGVTYAEAYGINVESSIAVGSQITNSGTISVTANATNDLSGSATAYGIYFDDGTEGILDNSGTITATANGVTAATAYGIYVESTSEPDSQITNSGTISATATASSDASGSAEAYGIYFSEQFAGTMDNSGTITATATGATAASATGIYIGSTMLTGSQLTNSGTVTATAVTTVSGAAEARSIYISTMEGTTFTNAATAIITANSTSLEGHGVATGFEVDNFREPTPEFTETSFVSLATITAGAFSTIINEGTITAVAEGGAGSEGLSAFGMDIGTSVESTGSSSNTVFATEALGASVSSSGTISATATSTGSGPVEAYGIFIEGMLFANGPLDNSGTINASASGVVGGGTESDGIRAAGIYVYSGMAAGSTLTNSGTINATAAGPGADASGIHIDRSTSGAILTNTATGVITASSTSSEGLGEATGLRLDVGNIAEPIPAIAGGSIVPLGTSTVGADSTIINEGTITAVAEGGAGSEGLHAFGMHIGSYVESMGSAFATISVTQALNASVSSSGTISATATSTGSGPVEAYGIFIHGMLSATGPLDNSGTINASASGVVGGGTASDGIRAAGIYVFSGMEAGSTLTNSGTINATAAGPAAEASGIRVDSSTAGAISNSGDIAVTGGGVVEAHGIYIFSMESGATLSNSGTITASPVQGAFSLYVDMGNGASISNSGRLDGGLYLSGASLASTGTVAMPVGVSGFIGGDYTQSGSGVLEIGVLSSSAGGYGQLRVDGTADLTGSDRVAVNVSANELLVDGETIQDVLSAGTLVTGLELTATDNSTLWDFTALNDGTNNIDLGVIRGLFVADAVRLTGPEWALGAATSLDVIIDEGPVGDMETVIGELGTLGTEAEVSQAAAQMVPVLVAQGAQMANLALNNITGAAIDRNAARKGMAAGDELMSAQHVWIRPFGSDAHQDERDGVPGYDIDNLGLIIGYDLALDDAWTVGGAIGYSSSDAQDDSDLIDHELEVESVQLAAYADWQIDQNMFMELIGVVGTSDNDSERVIRFAGIDRKAKGNYDSWYGRLYSGVGRDFVHDRLTLTPVLNATYSYIEDDSYTETGADSINLDVSDNDADSFVVGIDGRLAYALNEQNSLFTAHAGVGYDTISDTPALTSTFVGGGPAFVTEGAEPDQVVLQAGVGLEFHASEQVDIYINYEFEGREDFSNQLATATVRYAF